MHGHRHTNTNNEVLEAIGDLAKELSETSQNVQAILQKLQNHDIQLAELKRTADKFLGSQQAYLNDLSDVLNRISELEERLPTLQEDEVKELQQLLKAVAEWALKAARSVAIPLKLPT